MNPTLKALVLKALTLGTQVIELNGEIACGVKPSKGHSRADLEAALEKKRDEARRQYEEAWDTADKWYAEYKQNKKRETTEENLAGGSEAD